MEKRVVVVGGGMSAASSAKILLKLPRVQVTIVQANRFVEWPMAMTAVLARPELHDRAVAPNPSQFQLPGVAYKYGIAVGVDAANKHLLLKDGSMLPYDVLVAATGWSIPLLYPRLGVTLAERKRELSEAAEAIRKASTVVICGGGAVGCELAGDLRVAHPDKRIVLAVRDAVLKSFPEYVRSKAIAELNARSIEVLAGDISGAPEEARLSPGTFHCGETLVSYDAFFPAYSSGPSTSFLRGVDGALDERGRVKVSKYLQCEKYPDIFAVGVGSLDESFIGYPKLQAQWADATANIAAHLVGRPLKEHKEGMPTATAPVMVKLGVGPGGWASIDTAMLPLPVRCCICCGGLAGFPCCPCPCCWCCLPPCTCGYCCGPTSGEGPAIFAEKLGLQSASRNFKGMGETYVPEQQAM